MPVGFMTPFQILDFFQVAWDRLRQRHAVATAVRRTAGARGISQVSLDREARTGVCVWYQVGIFAD